MSAVGAKSSAVGSAGTDGPGPGFRWTWSIGFGLVALSRALALFDGPWEADEALFSLGVLELHVPGHRPHPPGFPGFVLAGRVIWWLVGDPLLALRLLSIAGSLLGIVALDRLLRRIVSPPIAALTAFAFAFVPGVWAHSARAFTTTPALGLILAAGWIWTVRRERDGPRSGPGSGPGPWPWLLIAWALTMRPQLVVPLAVALAGIGAIALRRAGPRCLLRPALWAGLGALAVAGAYAGVALDSGGFAPYLAALEHHAAAHGRAIGAGGGLPALERLCLVRVMGGVGGFAAIVVLASAGAILAFVRVGLGFGLTAVAVVAVTTATLVYAHHPAFPRYSVVWVAVLTPWVALSLDALAAWPRRAGSASALGLGHVLGLLAALAGAVASWPAIAYMRGHPLPAVAAVDLAVAGGARELLHSPGTSPFVRLLAESPRSPKLAPDQLDHAVLPRDRRLDRTAALLQVDAAVLDGATVIRDLFEIDSPAARRLGQDRYDRAVLVRQGVVLGAQMYRIERDPGGERFVWLGERARLFAPSGLDDPAHRLVLDLLVVGDRAPQRVVARCDAIALGQWTLAAGPAQLELPLADCRGAVELELPDARLGGREARKLSLRLLRAWVEGPGVAVADASWSLGDREALAALGVEHDGFYNPENFASRQGRWMAGEGTLSFPAEPGIIELTLARPPFLEAEGEVVIETDADRYVGGLDDQPMTVRLRTEAPDGRARVELRGPSFVPSARRAQSRDDRELAVIVYGVARRRDDR